MENVLVIDRQHDACVGTLIADGFDDIIPRRHAADVKWNIRSTGFQGNIIDLFDNGAENAQKPNTRGSSHNTANQRAGGSIRGVIAKRNARIVISHYKSDTREGPKVTAA